MATESYLQLLPHAGRLATGNPLGRRSAAVATMLDIHPQPFAVGHMLFQPGIRDFIDRSRAGGVDIDGLRLIRVDLLESEINEGQLTEPAIFELGAGGIELMLACLRAMDCPAAPAIMESREASVAYSTGEARNRRATAARIVGLIEIRGRRIPFDIRLGRGVGIDRKALTLKYRGGDVEEIDLSEDGIHSHERMIDELLTAERPDLGLEFSEAVEVVRLCSDAQHCARHDGAYHFGDLPPFLNDLRRDLVSREPQAVPCSAKKSAARHERPTPRHLTAIKAK